MLSNRNIGWTTMNTCEGIVRFFGANDKASGVSCLFDISK